MFGSCAGNLSLTSDAFTVVKETMGHLSPAILLSAVSALFSGNNECDCQVEWFASADCCWISSFCRADKKNSTFLRDETSSQTRLCAGESSFHPAARLFRTQCHLIRMASVSSPDRKYPFSLVSTCLRGIVSNGSDQELGTNPR